MIQLLYYKITERLPEATFKELLQRLPQAIQHKILQFRHWEDAERSLAGNIILMKGLQMIGRNGYALTDLKYTEFLKPYFDGTIHFNISHSGSYVICAISQTNKVGVDVEAVKEIPLTDFTNLFAPEEWEEVLQGNNELTAFYTLWTRKEAFLKAVGCGLSQPLNEVVILHDTIVWQNTQWFLHPIKLDEGHIAYLCCDTPNPDVLLQQTDY